mgnify:CR=1 FL=1
MHRVAEEPGEHGTAAAAQPEAAGEVSPAGAGEQVSRWVFNRGVRGGDVGLLAGLVIQQEQQAEDVNSADGGQQACGLLIFRGPQGTADREGAVQQVAEGCAGLQSTEVGGDALRAVPSRLAYSICIQL